VLKQVNRAALLYAKSKQQIGYLTALLTRPYSRWLSVKWAI